MEQCLHSYFIFNHELKHCCDFISANFEIEGAVYEVIRIIDSKPLFLDEHFRRWVDSAKNNAVQLVIDFVQVKQYLHHLIDINKVECGNVKFIAANKTQNNSVEFGAWFIPFAYPTAEMYEKGVNVSTFCIKRENPNVKSLRLEYKRAVNQALRLNNVFELLLINDEYITEGSRSNVFFIHENTLITAPKEMVLQGVTRNKIIEIAKQNGIKVEEKPVNLTEITKYSAAFLSGTSPKVLPVKKINSFQHFDVKHPMLQQIMQRYNAYVEANLRHFNWENS